MSVKIKKYQKIYTYIIYMCQRTYWNSGRSGIFLGQFVLDKLQYILLLGFCFFLGQTGIVRPVQIGIPVCPRKN